MTTSINQRSLKLINWLSTKGPIIITSVIILVCTIINLNSNCRSITDWIVVGLTIIKVILIIMKILLMRNLGKSSRRDDVKDLYYKILNDKRINGLDYGPDDVIQELSIIKKCPDGVLFSLNMETWEIQIGTNPLGPSWRSYLSTESHFIDVLRGQKFIVPISIQDTDMTSLVNTEGIIDTGTPISMLNDDGICRVVGRARVRSIHGEMNGEMCHAVVAISDLTPDRIIFIRSNTVLIGMNIIKLKKLIIDGENCEITDRIQSHRSYLTELHESYGMRSRPFRSDYDLDDFK